MSPRRSPSRYRLPPEIDLTRARRPVRLYRPLARRIWRVLVWLPNLGIRLFQWFLGQHEPPRRRPRRPTGLD